MKIGLQTARVRPVGSSGIAHRTAAGFVMLGTADSRKVLSIIEQNAAESNLVELVIAELSVAAPEAFCFLFVSQGELFALTCGSAVISLTTSTGLTTIEPQPQQVLIQRLDLGVGDSDGRLVLFQKGMTVDQVDGLDSVVDLQSGTVLADALDLTVRRATADATGTTAAQATVAENPVASDTEIAAAAVQTSSAPSDETTTPSALATAGTADNGTRADTAATTTAATNTAAMNTAAASTDPVPAAVPGASMPAAPPPAADEILFAEDIGGATTSDSVPQPIPPGERMIDAPALAAPDTAEPILDIPTPLPGSRPQTPIPGTVLTAPLAASAAAAVVVPSAASPSVPPALSSDPAGAFSGVLRESSAPAAPPPTSEPDMKPVALPPPRAKVGPVMVLGVTCPDGHHNHPDATECSECAARIGEHHTTVLMNGPRPPLGLLMVDDGKTWSLANDLIIGREPSTHEDVAGGGADSMALTDDTLSLSRHHARISLDDWSAYVIDLGSSNGTYLNRNRSAQEWSPVPSDMALQLEPGDRLRVGGRIIQIELYQFAK